MITLHPKLGTQATQRLRAVAVGDLIQYRYSYGPKGFTQWAISTRAVMEIIDEGAEFVVEGCFHVFAKNVTTHIPMHTDDEGDDDTLESADKLL